MSTVPIFINRKLTTYYATNRYTGMRGKTKPQRNGEASTETAIENLYREIADTRGIESDGTEIRAENRMEKIVNETVGGLFGDHFRFDEEIVKHSLEEILIALVAVNDSNTHGKSLMEDISMVFDSRLSPGTVYPALHALEDEETLEQHKLVRTKVYEIGNSERSVERLEETMKQHLSVAMTLYSVLQEYELLNSSE